MRDDLRKPAAQPAEAGVAEADCVLRDAVLWTAPQHEEGLPYRPHAEERRAAARLEARASSDARSTFLWINLAQRGGRLS